MFFPHVVLDPDDLLAGASRPRRRRGPRVGDITPVGKCSSSSCSSRATRRLGFCVRSARRRLFGAPLRSRRSSIEFDARLTPAISRVPWFCLPPSGRLVRIDPAHHLLQAVEAARRPVGAGGDSASRRSPLLSWRLLEDHRSAQRDVRRDRGRREEQEAARPPRAPRRLLRPRGGTGHQGRSGRRGLPSAPFSGGLLDQRIVAYASRRSELHAAHSMPPDGAGTLDRGHVSLRRLPAEEPLR